MLLNVKSCFHPRFLILTLSPNRIESLIFLNFCFSVDTFTLAFDLDKNSSNKSDKFVFVPEQMLKTPNSFEFTIVKNAFIKSLMRGNSIEFDIRDCKSKIVVSHD